MILQPSDVVHPCDAILFRDRRTFSRMMNAIGMITSGRNESRKLKCLKIFLT